MIGEYLYALTPRDAVVDHLQVVSQVRVFLDSASFWSRRFAVPDDRAFYITAIGMGWDTGAAYNCTLCTCTVANEQNIGYITLINTQPNSPGGSITQTPGSPILLMPRQRLLFSYSWAGTSGNNAGFIHIMGVLIPRGTLSSGELNLVP